MKRRKNQLFNLNLCMMLMASTVLWAQEEQKSGTENEIPYLHRHSLAVSGGVIGYGGEYAYNLNKNLNLRLGANFFTLGEYNTVYTLDDRDVNVTANADIFNLDFLIEYLPFSKSSFKLVFGGAYLNNFSGTGTVGLADTLFFGEVPINPEDAGSFEVQLDYSNFGGLAPYVGFGFGRAVPKRRVGFGFELGTYYIGSPKVIMQATEIFEPTANEMEQQKLEDAFSSFTWLPSMKFKLTVRL